MDYTSHGIYFEVIEVLFLITTCSDALISIRSDSKHIIVLLLVLFAFP